MKDDTAEPMTLSDLRTSFKVLSTVSSSVSNKKLSYRKQIAGQLRRQYVESIYIVTT